MAGHLVFEGSQRLDLIWKGGRVSDGRKNGGVLGACHRRHRAERGTGRYEFGVVNYQEIAQGEGC